MDFFAKFTEGAKNALKYAEEKARELGHNYVGTEHLLLGLICEKEGAAANLLRGGRGGECTAAHRQG